MKRVMAVVTIGFAVLAFNSRAMAASSGVTYQGRILKPNGTPLSGQFTQFKMQIRTPDAAGCLMYEEIQSQDLRNSGGVFSLTINDGTGSRIDSTGLTLDRIFANRGTFSLDVSTCSIGTGSYTPNVGDGRSLIVLFKDETMATWEPIPPQKINYVPYAFSAQSIQGFAADSLLRVVNGSGDPLTGLAPLSNAQYTALLDLINGSSAAYTKAGQLNGVALPAMTTGEVLGWNGTAWVSQAAPSGPNSITTTMIQNGAVDGTKLDPAISISTSGMIAAAVTTTRDFKIYAASPSNFYVGMLADPTLAASYTLTWPLTAGAANQVLTTDGSGKLTWTTPSSAGITDLTGDVTASGPGSAAATIANNAVTTSKINDKAVTYAKIQDVTSGKLLGRSTVGAGAVEEISVGTGLSFSGGILSSTASDSFAALPCGDGYVPYKSAGSWTCKAVDAGNTNDAIVSRDSLGSFIANNAKLNSLSLNNAGSTVTLQNLSGSNYTLTLPATAGSGNQVLTTDGLGGLSWTTPLSGMTGFVQGGNTFGAAANLGTNDNFDLNLKTNNLNRMTVTAFGYVGIGTTSPNGNLDVKGSIVMSGATSGFTGFQPSATAGSTVYTLPSSLTAGGYLTTDGSGNLTWSTPAGTGVTSVTSANTDIGVANTTTTPVLTLNSGTGPDQILKLNGSSQIPAVDGSLITNLNASSFGSGTLPVSRGGTGAISFANYSVIASNASGNQVAIPGSTSNTMLQWTVTGPEWSLATWPSATTANKLLYSSANDVVGQLDTANNGVLVTDGTGVPSIASTLPAGVQGNITSVGTIASGTWNGSAIGAGYGGTGQISYTTGDLLYANSASSLAKLPASTSGYILTSNGAGVAPSWQAATGGMSGSGTANYLPKFTAGTTLGNSAIYETGGNVGIGTTSPAGILDVQGGVSALPGSGQSITLVAQAASTSGTGGHIYLNPGAGSSGWPSGSVVINSNAPTVLQALSVSRSGTDSYTPYAAKANPNLNTNLQNGYYADGNAAIMGMTTGNAAILKQSAYFGAVSTAGAANYSPALVWGQTTAPSSYAERMRIDSSGNVGIGSASPPAFFTVKQTSTATDALSGIQAWSLLPMTYKEFTYSPSAAPTTNSVAADSSYMSVTGSNFALGNAQAYKGITNWQGSAAPGSLSGLAGEAYMNGTSATGGGATGIYGFATLLGSGLLTTSTGASGSGYNQSSTGGTVVSVKGGAFAATQQLGTTFELIGTSAISNISAGQAVNNRAIGLYTQVNNQGTVPYSYGLYIDNIQGTKPFSIYASDAGAPSYFAGNVGIGTTAPDGFLDVQGGAAAADTDGKSITLTAQNGTGPSNMRGGSIRLNAGLGGGSGGLGGSVMISATTGEYGALSLNYGGNNGYTPTSGPRYSGQGVMNVINGWSVDGNSALTRVVVKNAATVEQLAYYGAVSIPGAGVYAPDFIFGRTTAGGGVTNETMRLVGATGNVGIGTTNPQTKLAVDGIISSSVDNTHSLGSSSFRFTDIYATGSIISTSDGRSKTNVQDSDLGLDFINDLRPVSYNWKEGDKTLHYGVIAQETETAIREAKAKSGRADEASGVIVNHDEKTDRYGVKYTELIAPIIKAIQELYGEVFGVKGDVATLKAENAAQARSIASKADKTEVDTRLKAKDQEIKQLKQENAEMKARLDKIEKMIKPRDRDRSREGAANCR